MLLYTRYKLLFSRYKGTFSMDYRERGIPCTRCVSHTVYLTHGKCKGEIRGRSRNQNISNRVVLVQREESQTRPN